MQFISYTAICNKFINLLLKFKKNSLTDLYLCLFTITALVIKDFSICITAKTTATDEGRVEYGRFLLDKNEKLSCCSRTA